MSTSVGAQTTAATAAAARVAPDGRLVATMRVGAAVQTGAKKADWTAVTIEGFLHKSVVTAKRDALTIHAASGAALRSSADPSAPLVAVIEDGVQVEKLSTKGDWYRVKRDAWVQTRELKTGAKAPPPVAAAPARALGAPQKVAALP
ncbi:MAG: SH3 domain-containing protein, partial [Gemmatimonadaceae bacterium]|nr:SH3 domain-containing protein [Gemmatimonadaceae bacterium]